MGRVGWATICLLAMAVVSIAMPQAYRTEWPPGGEAIQLAHMVSAPAAVVAPAGEIRMDAGLARVAFLTRRQQAPVTPRVGVAPRLKRWRAWNPRE